MFESLEAYDSALDRLFSVPRSLSDRTPVAGPSPEERVLMAEFIADSVRQRGQPGFLGCYELNDEANPYVLYLLCLRPLIAAMAAEKGKTVVFAVTTGAMESKAYLNHLSLSVLEPIEFIIWGDLAEIARAPNSVLSKIFIIGDMDFEPDNASQQLSSSNGIVRHEETLKWINSRIRNKHADMLLFHRKGWASAINLSSLKDVARQGESKPAESKSGCFIATACYDSPEYPAVKVLRRFRDEEVARHRTGRLLIRLYEWLSPPVARVIQSRRWARRVMRRVVVAPLSRWAGRRLGSGP